MDFLPSLMVSILDFYRESKMTLQEAFAEVRDTRRGPAVGYTKWRCTSLQLEPSMSSSLPN
jgi:hypothetical protein